MLRRSERKLPVDAASTMKPKIFDARKKCHTSIDHVVSCTTLYHCQSVRAGGGHMKHEVKFEY